MIVVLSIGNIVGFFHVEDSSRKTQDAVVARAASGTLVHCARPQISKEMLH